MEFNVMCMECTGVIPNGLKIWPVSALIRMTKKHISNHLSQTSTSYIQHTIL